MSRQKPAVQISLDSDASDGWLSRLMLTGKHMRFPALIAFPVVVMTVAFAVPKVSAADTNAVPVPKVAITNLLAHREAYQGKRVEVSGYYLGFFEHYALYERESKRVFTNSLWIDPFREQSNYRQNISGGRADFRGNVRLIGTFHYRPDLMGVGHLNGWRAEITNLELFEKTE